MIAGDAIRDIALKALAKDSQTLPPIASSTFSLRHPDISVNNIFVDDDLNITCLIDWTFCSAVPESRAIIPPGLPQSRDRLDEDLTRAFVQGFEPASKNTMQSEKHTSLSANNDVQSQVNGVQPTVKDVQSETNGVQCKVNDVQSEVNEHQQKSFREPAFNRQIWPMSRLLDFDTLGHYHLFAEIWEQAEDPEDFVSDLFKQAQSSSHYRSLQVELSEDDPTPEEVAKEEDQCFVNYDVTSRLTIARHLTLVSEWSLRYSPQPRNSLRRNGMVFVADKRLWKWIENCVKFDSRIGSNDTQQEVATSLNQTV